MNCKLVIFSLVATLCMICVTNGQIPIGLCTKINACSCFYDDGTIVNLAPLDRKDGKPNFNNVTDKSNDLFSWNPCTPFSFASNDSECENVALCMIRQGIPQELVYDLGNQDTAEFSVNTNGTLLLTYTADKGDYKRVSQIALQCMEGSKFDFFVADGEQEEQNDTILYKFTLASPLACPKGPNLRPADEVHSLGAGYIILIVIASFICAYVVFGVMFQAFVKKESGKKLCPNHEFWFSIFGGCKGKTDKGAKYDSI